MKSFVILVSGFASAVVAQAASCSASNAEPVTFNNGGGSGGGGGEGGVPNLYGCIDMVTYENHCEIEYRRLAIKRSLMTVSKRDGLYCTSSEACISLEDEILCYNPTTDYFHIADGTEGNFRTGDYLLPDGQTGNLFNGPFPTLSSSTTAGASRTTVRSSNVASSTKSVLTIDAADATISSTLADSTTKSRNPTTASPASATTTSTSATTTTNSGNQKRGHRHLVGAVIGMAGLLAL